MSNQNQLTKFFDLYSVGKALAEEVDDYVDIWHSDECETSERLSEFLGLTDDEYSAFIHDAKALPFILTARRNGQSLEDVMDQRVNELSFAARASDRTAIIALHNWLKDRQAKKDIDGRV